RTCKIASRVRGVSDRGANGENVLQALLSRLQFRYPCINPFLKLVIGPLQRILCDFALSDISPRANELSRLTCIVAQNSERVLDPDVVAIVMPKTIFKGTATVLY